MWNLVSMSRIGRLPVIIPEKVQVTIENQKVTVKGPLGELSLNIPNEVTVELKDAQVIVKRKSDKRRFKMMHGTIRSLVDNMVQGVVKPYVRELELKGVGYRVALEGNKLALNIGYKHPIYIEVPKDIKVEVPSQTEITISGIDKEKVGQFMAKIRLLRPPEPYKGKGIREKGEIVHRKVIRTLTA